MLIILSGKAQAYIGGTYGCWGQVRGVSGGAQFYIVNDTDHNINSRVYWVWPNENNGEGIMSSHYSFSLNAGETYSYPFDITGYDGIIEIYIESAGDQPVAVIDVEYEERHEPETDQNRCPEFEGTWDYYDVYAGGGHSGGPTPEWLPLIDGSGYFSNRSGKPWRLRFSSSGNSMGTVNIPYGDIANPSYGPYEFGGAAGSAGEVAGPVNVEAEWGEDQNHDGVYDTWHSVGSSSYVVGPTEFHENENGDHVYDFTMPDFEPPVSGYEGYQDAYSGMENGNDVDGSGLTQDDTRRAVEEALENQDLSKYHLVDALNRSLDGHGLRRGYLADDLEKALDDRNLNAGSLGNSIGNRIVEAVEDIDLDTDAIEDVIILKGNEIKSSLASEQSSRDSFDQVRNHYLEQIRDYNLTAEQQAQTLAQLEIQHNAKLDTLNESIENMGSLTIENEVDLTGLVIELDTDLGTKIDNVNQSINDLTANRLIYNKVNLNSIQRKIGEEGGQIENAINNQTAKIDDIKEHTDHIRNNTDEIESKLDDIKEAIEEQELSLNEEIEFTEEDNEILISEVSRQEGIEAIERIQEGVESLTNKVSSWVGKWTITMPGQISRQATYDIHIVDKTATIDLSQWSGIIAVFRAFVLYAIAIYFFLSVVGWTYKTLQ
jgi:hypothetical protein